MFESMCVLLALALGQSDGTDVPDLSEYQFAQAQRTDVTDGRTRVAVEANAAVPSAGSFGMRVLVDNTQGPAGTLTLTYRANAQGFHVVRREVELRAAERRVITIPVSADLRYGTLSASGAGTKPGEASVYFQSVFAPNKIVLAIGTADAFQRFAGHAPDYSGGSESAAVEVVLVPPAEASNELAAYSGYDAVVLPEAGALDALDEGQQRALEAYAATGGSLVLAAPMRATRALPLLTSNVGTAAYAFGKVVIRQVGDTQSVMRNDVIPHPRGAGEFEQRYGASPIDALLPQATAPLGRFLIIIFCFTVAIGPGSIWVARRRGPAALLVTIPLTAFITCALIVGYSLIADGFSIHAASYGLTWLDRQQHRAISVGVRGYYANLSPPSASFGTLSTVIAPYDTGNEHFAADVTWHDGFTMGTDFIPSRVYREWGVLAVEPTRARLIVKVRNDKLVVQNSLGHHIRLLNVKSDSVVFSAREIADGAERELEKGPVEMTFDKSDRLTSVPDPDKLGEGRFFAELSDDGFLPTGGLSTTLHAGQHWVTGEFEP